MKTNNSIFAISQHNNNISFSAHPIPASVKTKIQSQVLKANSVDVFCHSSPDEDTFNAAKTLANWLMSSNKKVRIIVEDKFAGLFSQDCEKLQFVNPKETSTLNKADLALLVDFNSRSRIIEQGLNFLNKYNKNEILGLDHHQPDIERSLIQNTDINNNSLYNDTSAKSCCGIIYRLFQGLGTTLNENNLCNLYCGMLDDLNKSRLIEIVRKDGLYSVKRTEKIQEFAETVEILDKIENRLSSEKKAEILKHLDIFSNLTPKEADFREKLFKEKIQFTNNGKLAYVVINPEDQQWKDIGQINLVTSKILSNFRERLLTNNPNDELIPVNLKDKLNKIKGVIVFYRGEKAANPKDEVYKLSIHSKDGYASKLINYIKDHLYPELNVGGHTDRKGGSISMIEPDKCNQFVNYFTTAAEKVD